MEVTGVAEHELFLKEKKQIDELLEQGYRIQSVEESWFGTKVKFQLPNKLAEEKELLLRNPNARKYIGSCLIKQKRMIFLQKEQHPGVKEAY